MSDLSPEYKWDIYLRCASFQKIDLVLMICLSKHTVVVQKTLNTDLERWVEFRRCQNSVYFVNCTLEIS